MDLIRYLNQVDSQVWAIVVILTGAALVSLHQPDSGSLLIGGGLAILKQREAPAKSE